MQHGVKVAWLAMTRAGTSAQNPQPLPICCQFPHSLASVPIAWAVLYQRSYGTCTQLVASLLLCGVAAWYSLLLACWAISSARCYLRCYIFGNSWPHLLLYNWESWELRELKTEFLTGYSTLALAGLLLWLAVADIRIKKSSTQPSPLERQLVSSTTPVPFSKSSRYYEELQRI